MAATTAQAAARSGTAPQPLLRLATSAMATRFELLLGGGTEPFLRAAGEEALAEIHACEAAISPFLPGSTTSRIHREAAARGVRTDPLTFELLEACARLHADTRGAFDPTVGPLLVALGLRGRPMGDARAVEAARRLVGFGRVELDRSARQVRFGQAGMRLDFGAIGKGWALDLAAEALRDAGVPRALLHGGTSTVVAIGSAPGTEGFRVAVPTPTGVTFDVRLADAALSVSRRVSRDRGTPHLVDPGPRSLSPTRLPVLAAFASTGPATDADAWSTALLVDPGLPLPRGATALLAFGDGHSEVLGRRQPDAAPTFRERRRAPGPRPLTALP